MYEPQDSEEHLAAFGLSLEDYAYDFTEIWPDNYAPVSVFSKLATQWRVGMSGYTGLDYGVLFHIMDRMHLSDEDYQLIEDDIRVLENAALAEMHRAQKEA